MQGFQHALMRADTREGKTALCTLQQCRGTIKVYLAGAGADVSQKNNAPAASGCGRSSPAGQSSLPRRCDD